MKRTAKMRREAIYQYIVQYWRENGISPSTRDICEAVDIASTSTASQDIHALMEEGRIQQSEGRYRSYRPIEDIFAEDRSQGQNDFHTSPAVRNDVYDIPLYGAVAAGAPIYADDYTEESVPLPATFFPNDGARYFILTIHGDSMIEAGIFDGDHVIVRQQKTARDGQQVVARMEDSATVKTLYRHPDHIELRPENAAYEPIRVKECEILGVVCGLYRLY